MKGRMIWGGATLLMLVVLSSSSAQAQRYGRGGYGRGHGQSYGRPYYPSQRNYRDQGYYRDNGYRENYRRDRGTAFSLSYRESRYDNRAYSDYSNNCDRNGYAYQAPCRNNGYAAANCDQYYRDTCTTTYAPSCPRPCRSQFEISISIRDGGNHRCRY